VLEQRENASKERDAGEGRKRENKNDENIGKTTYKTQQEKPKRVGKIEDGLAHMP